MAGLVFYAMQNERKKAKDVNKNDRRKKLVRGEEEKIEEEWRRKGEEYRQMEGERT